MRKPANQPAHKLSFWCDMCGKFREIVYRLNGQTSEYQICNKCLKEHQVVE